MSSAGRGPAGGGDREFFPTPAWCVRRLLERVSLPGGRWLEPTAGDGAIVRAVNEVRSDVRWAAFEVRPECRPSLSTELDRRGPGGGVFVIGDFLNSVIECRCDVAILNPPFSLALPIIDRCLAVCDQVVALQRTTWLADEEDRYGYFRELVPDEYRIGRVDFDGRGGDSTTYSWFAWGPESTRYRARGAYELLPRTSLEERKASHRQLALVSESV